MNDAKKMEQVAQVGEVAPDERGRVPAPKIVYPTLPNHRSHNWKSRLDHLLRTHGHFRINGTGQASHRTYQVRDKVLFRIFEMLEGAGFRIEDPARIDIRHVEHVLKEWERRRILHDQGQPGGLAPATVANELSVLRTFCRWIGQPQLVDQVQFEIENAVTRTRAAKTDKTWEGNGIDVFEVVSEVWDVEPWAAVVVLLVFTLGLREKEAMMFKPFVAHEPGQPFVLLNIERGGRNGYAGNRSAGTKGGRGRVIALDVPWEQDVLDFAREFVRLRPGYRNLSVGPEGLLHSNLRRLNEAISDFGVNRKDAGVTLHGLRAQFAVRKLHRHGVEAPVRGGNLKALPKEERDLLLRLVAEDLGHSRTSITSSYYGSVHQVGDITKIDFDPDAVIAPRIADLLQKLRAKLAEMKKIDRAIRSYDRLVHKR